VGSGPFEKAYTVLYSWESVPLHRHLKVILFTVFMMMSYSIKLKIFFIIFLVEKLQRFMIFRIFQTIL